MIGSDYYKVLPAKEIVNISKLLDFASDKHKWQKRRNGDPYIGHCIKVGGIAADIASQCGEDSIGINIVTAAGVGHDLIEDTNTDYDDIVKYACDEVAAIISWVSDDKRLPGCARHRNYIGRLAAAPSRAHIVKLADIFDNTRDSFELLSDLDKYGQFLIRWRLRAIDELNVLTGVHSCEQYASTFIMLNSLARRIEDAGVVAAVEARS